MKTTTIVCILAIILAMVFGYLWWTEKQKLAGKSYWYDEAVYTKRGNDTVVILRMKNLNDAVLKSPDAQQKIMTEEISETEAIAYLKNYDRLLQANPAGMQKTYSCTFDLLKLLQIADKNADEIRIYFGCYPEASAGHHSENQLTTFVRGVAAKNESGKIANLGKLCPDDCSSISADQGSIYIRSAISIKK